jgi:hypothetical protein
MELIPKTYRLPHPSKNSPKEDKNQKLQSLQQKWYTPPQTAPPNQLNNIQNQKVQHQYELNTHLTY